MKTRKESKNCVRSLNYILVAAPMRSMVLNKLLDKVPKVSDKPRGSNKVSSISLGTI